MEKVSIIVPIYNSSKVIERCLESILNQTYSNIEIICINDGSTDNSLELIKKIENKDSRIKKVNKENSGVSSARNLGLEFATGKYILFVDADDFIENNMVEKLVNTIITEKSDLVICNYKIKFYDKIVKNKFKVKEKSVDKKNFLKYLNQYCKKAFFNQPWNKLYVKSKISNNFSLNLYIGEDLQFNINYLNEINKISFLNEYLYIYDTTTENSLTKTKENSLRQLLNIYKDMYRKLYYDNHLVTSIFLDIYILKTCIHHLNIIYKKEINSYLKLKKMFSQYKDIADFKNEIKFNTNLDIVIKKIIFSKILFKILVILYLILK